MILIFPNKLHLGENAAENSELVPLENLLNVLPETVFDIPIPEEGSTSTVYGATNMHCCLSN